MNVQKLIEIGDKHKDTFIEMARAVIAIEVGETDDENKELIAQFTARDMAIGAAEMRKYHIGYGVVLGLGTAGAVSLGKKVIKKIKDKDKDDEITIVREPFKPNL